MDRRGYGAWNSSSSNSSSSSNGADEQDQGGNSNNSCSSSGGGCSRSPASYGDAHPFYESTSGGSLPDPYGGGSRGCHYNTNNNDYSKYPGGNGDLPSPTTDYYSTYGSSSGGSSSSPGGYYTTQAGSPDYHHDQDYNYMNNTDYLRAKRAEHVGYSDSQCLRDPSEQGPSACNQPGYSDYSDYTGRQQEYTPSRVHVTAKVLFGSVSAISNLKQKKPTKK